MVLVLRKNSNSENEQQSNIDSNHIPFRRPFCFRSTSELHRSIFYVQLSWPKIESDSTNTCEIRVNAILFISFLFIEGGRTECRIALPCAAYEANHCNGRRNNEQKAVDNNKKYSNLFHFERCLRKRPRDHRN